MKSLLTLFLVLFNLVASAQKLTVVRTDSSRIESRVYPGGKEVKEFIKSKDRVNYRFYRDNQAKATTTSTYTKAGRAIGITREYSDEGKLLYSVDHDNGRWIIATAVVDPYQGLRQQIKQKADQLIAAVYGQYFLLHNAVWNVRSSAMYNEAIGGDWTDVFAQPPTKFLLRYDVKLDREHVYPELIEFALDAQGNFITDDYGDVYGFEQLLIFPVEGFGLSYRTALEATQKYSGVKSSLLNGFLKWEKVKSPFLYTYGLYTGQFRFYVPVKTGVQKDLHPKGRSRVTEYYDVYSFNPWTGAFTGKQQMESIHEWEERSGFSSGLRPRR
jgi:hypothetical protein